MVRKANINDAKEIIRINVISWKTTYKGIFSQNFLDKLDPNDMDSIKKCQNKLNEYAVYEIDNKIVAMIRYGKNKKGYDNSYAEVYALYVDNNYKQKGIGTELIKFAFKELKKDYNYVLISTLIDNSANIFYQKIGGKLIGKSTFSIDNNDFI